MQTSIIEYSKTVAALAVLGQKYKGVIFDVQTPKGMKGAVDARAEIRGYRVDLEKTRKDTKAPALKRCLDIDSEAKMITAELSALENPIDQQIKQEEQRKEAEKQARIDAERERLNSIQAKISAIRNHPATLTAKSADEIDSERVRLATYELAPEVYQEYHGEAVRALGATVQQLTEMVVEVRVREAEAARIQEEQSAEAARILAERAELERLRAESVEREIELKRFREIEEARLRHERDTEEAKLREESARFMAEQIEADRIRQEEEAKLRAEREKQELLQRIEEERLSAERAEAERIRQQQEAEAARLEEERRQIEAEKKAAEQRRKKLQKARRDTPSQALADILAICQSDSYTDTEARNDISLIAEASL